MNQQRHTVTRMKAARSYAAADGVEMGELFGELVAWMFPTV
jgi:hypothetical protein